LVDGNIGSSTLGSAIKAATPIILYGSIGRASRLAELIAFRIHRGYE
jgi:hypothetical protein